MRKFLVLLATISLVTGITAAPSSALSASTVATASENETVRISASFPLGTAVLTKSQKAGIKKVVANSGTDATFLVTAAAGKLPGVSNVGVQLLAKKRGQVIKSYLVKLGVSKASVTTKVKINRLGSVPKTKIVGSAAAPAVAAPAVAAPAVAAPAAALTCANGGTCVVGNTGPGGGLVYYVDTAGFSCGATYIITGSPTGGLCKYLEVAPSLWNGGADPAKPWATGTSVSGNSVADEAGIANDGDVAYNNALGIGLGLKNSIAIVAQNGAYNATSNNYAAGAARAYAGNSKSDWYLPTTAELNLLCQWGRNVTQVVGTACTGGTLNTGTGANGGFGANDYVSSSESFALTAFNQYFSNGYQDHYVKYYPSYVRPVRAF